MPPEMEKAAKRSKKLRPAELKPLGRGTILAGISLAAVSHKKEAPPIA